MSRPFNPNKIPKRITAFNLDESVLKEFNEMCDSKMQNRSKIANNLFHDFMNQQKNKRK